jgi:hypothetical protein
MMSFPQKFPRRSGPETLRERQRQSQSGRFEQRGHCLATPTENTYSSRYRGSIYITTAGSYTFYLNPRSTYGSTHGPGPHRGI